MKARDAELREAQRLAHIGSWHWDAATDATTGSEELYRIYGLDPAKQSFPDFRAQDGCLYPHASWERINAAVQEAIQTGVGYELDVQALRAGEPIWITTRCEVIRGAEGRIVGLRGTVQDITERKRSEQLLAEQKDLLECIAAGKPLEECLQKLTGAVFRLHPNARAGVLMADAERRAMAEMFSAQLPPSFGNSIRGASIGELATGTCVTAVYSGQPVTCSNIAASERWSQRWRDLCVAHGILACHSTPVFNASGRAVASFFMCFDQAREPNEWERRIAEFGAHIASIAIERGCAMNALRAGDAQLQADLADAKLLQGLSTELIREDNVGAVYEKILDAAVAVMRSQFGSLQMFYPERGRGELRLLVFRGFNAQAARFWEWVRVDSESTCGVALHTGERVIAPDVQQCDFMAGTDDLATYLQTGIHAVQTTPLFTRGGQLIGMISTHWSQPHRPTERDLRLLDILARQAADLIERGQAEEALRAADRRKDEFLATLAHELRNPLAPLGTSLELIRRARGDASLIDSARATMQRQLSHMVRLVDDLLDVSRITRDKLELRRERVELAPIIHQAVEACRPMLEALGHDLRIGLPPEPITLDADSVRLAQVFGNLLNNACKYTDRGGRISLAVHRTDGEAVVTIKDSGFGIPPDKLASVFEMFTQIEQTIERSQGGLGIGLTLARRLVELHGGTITAASDGPRRGSEFTVRLPVAIDQAAAARQARGESPEITAHRILVVDDNRDAATSLAMLLKMTGHETYIAHDGQEGLEAAEKLRPCVILLDLGMPRLNGYDACRRVRERPWGKDTFIVALTGWGQDEDRRESKDAGFDHHLVKPVDFDVLMELLVSRSEAGESELTGP